MLNVFNSLNSLTVLSAVAATSLFYSALRPARDRTLFPINRQSTLFSVLSVSSVVTNLFVNWLNSLNWLKRINWLNVLNSLTAPTPYLLSPISFVPSSVAAAPRRELRWSTELRPD